MKKCIFVGLGGFPVNRKAICTNFHPVLCKRDLTRTGHPLQLTTPEFRVISDGRQKISLNPSFKTNKAAVVALYVEYFVSISDDRFLGPGHLSMCEPCSLLRLL